MKTMIHPTRPCRGRPYQAAAGLLLCALSLITGCGGPMVLVNDDAEFQKVVIESPRPVVVEMFKGG